MEIRDIFRLTLLVTLVTLGGTLDQTPEPADQTPRPVEQTPRPVDRTPRPGQCLTCEDYLGDYCTCNRYDIYWNSDKRLYGISECQGLTQIPDFRPLCQTGDLWEIRLNGIPLSVIPNDAFLGLYFSNTVQIPHFQPTIDLSNTGFRQVAHGSFEAVYDHLEKLVLDGNDLKSVPSEVFRLKALTHLHLKGNKLEDLPPNLESTLDNLEFLDLSDNNLRGIPPSMCDFPKLGEVDLQFNPISGDLSDYVHVLVKCVNLKTLLWPKTTMQCTCESMKRYSAEYSPQFAIPAKFRLTRGSSYRDMSLLCDKRSSHTFVGRPVEDITVGEVWRTCYNETCSCCENRPTNERATPPPRRGASSTASQSAALVLISLLVAWRMA